MLTIPVTPVAKPRMTRRDKWLKRKAVTKYWDYKDSLNFYCKALDFKPGNQIRLIFHVPMPKSWSAKKQKKFTGLPHQSRPDIDNFVKAFLDALLDDDKAVWHIDAAKYWSGLGKIEVENINENETKTHKT